MKENKSTKQKSNQHKSRLEYDKDLHSYVRKKYKEPEQKKNDPQWYTKFPELAKASGNIIYGQPMGEVFDLPGSRKVSLGGIMKINLLPAIGISKDASSPVNNMSRLVYSFIRHANSGSRNYEAPDYMTYCLAMGSAYAYYASLCRLYGVIRTYSTLNKFVAKATVEALNFDYDAIVKDLANLRYYINYFAARINTFAVPKDMTYYDRCAFLPLHIFKDNEGDKCSFYLFDYAKLFVWDGTTETTGSSLQTIEWGLKTSKTLQDITEVGEQIINALLLNEDVGIMSGDTLKAYGSGNVRVVNGIDDSYSTLPIYNHDMLWQIHNARIADVSNVVQNVKVIQKDGYLLYNPTISGYSGVNLGGQALVIDSDLETPDYVFNLENTRLHVRYNSNMTGFDSVGTELPVNAVIYQFMVEDEEQSFSNSVPADTTINALTFTATEPIIGLAMASTFKLHPIWYVQATADSVVLSTSTFGDLNNFTQISNLAIAQLHNAALLSLFSVPNAAVAAK